MIWTTVYNPAIDVVYAVQDLTARNTFIDLDAQVFPAGKGINFAKVVASLGEEVSVLSLMPETEISRFSDYLERRSIHHHFLPVPGIARINTTIYEKSSGMIQHFNSASQTFTTQTQDSMEQAIVTRLEHGDHWVLSGSLPSGMESNAYARIIQQCQNRQIPVSLDTRGLPLRLGINQAPTIITPNEEELLALYDEPVQGLQHLIFKGKQLIDRKIPFVFITLGEDGVIALHKNECLLCHAPSVTTIDTVGCGDAFLAGAVVGMVRGFSFKEMCRLAVACGSANAMSHGPGEVDADIVWRIMEKVTITEA